MGTNHVALRYAIRSETMRDFKSTMDAPIRNWRGQFTRLKRPIIGMRFYSKNNVK